MRETNVYRYYAFGYNYGILRRYGSGGPVRADANGLVERLTRLLDFLEELGLRVTLQASTGIVDLVTDAKSLAKDAVVDDALAKRARDAIEAIDVTLDAELQLRTAFVVTAKRYSIDHLLKTPGELLGKGVYAALTPLGQFDFAEACRCIAYDRPTASAFHLMRCVEGALRAYYCSIVKRERVKSLMWFDMVDHLSKRRDAPPRPVMDNLNNIRHNFRNPTQHPESRYDIDEAQDLLAVTIDAINRMARDVAQREAS